VVPPRCQQPGCQHHYWHLPEGCLCVIWPAARRGGHVFAVNPLCRAHHTVLDIIEDAAWVLSAHHDYLDPDDDEIPDDVFRELAELWRAGPCGICPGWGNPGALADHFLARKQEEWERSVPSWACDCGALYKRITEWQTQHFYKTTGDYGLLGDLAGTVRRNAKGQVKQSGACPACGRKFADTIARQDDPQQSLF
jgi:hypothetical protein